MFIYRGKNTPQFTLKRFECPNVLTEFMGIHPNFKAIDQFPGINRRFINFIYVLPVVPWCFKKRKFSVEFHSILFHLIKRF